MRRAWHRSAPPTVRRLALECWWGQVRRQPPVNAVMRWSQHALFERQLLDMLIECVRASTIRLDRSVAFSSSIAVAVDSSRDELLFTTVFGPRCTQRYQLRTMQQQIQLASPLEDIDMHLSECCTIDRQRQLLFAGGDCGSVAVIDYNRQLVSKLQVGDREDDRAGYCTDGASSPAHMQLQLLQPWKVQHICYSVAVDEASDLVFLGSANAIGVYTGEGMCIRTMPVTIVPADMVYHALLQVLLVTALTAQKWGVWLVDPSTGAVIRRARLPDACTEHAPALCVHAHTGHVFVNCAESRTGGSVCVIAASAL